MRRVGRGEVVCDAGSYVWQHGRGDYGLSRVASGPARLDLPMTGSRYYRRVMREALVAAAGIGVPVSQHAEDTRLTGGCSMNAGPVAFRLGLRGMPVEAEARIVERDIRLLKDIERAERLRAHLHVQHVSTAKAMALIRAAKAEGLHVTCEVAPHHFTLTDEAIADYDTNAKMNPPLRAESDGWR